MKQLKAACVQAAPVYMDMQGSVAKAVDLIAEAATNGAQLIAFPETWIPGYPWFVWLGAPAWGLQFIPQYHGNSMAVDSDEMRTLCEAAKKGGIYVLIGFSEKAGGSRYMAQALIGPEGQILYTRRKLKPTHVERTVFGDGDGSDFCVVETPLGNIGSLNCWEHLQPLSRMDGGSCLRWWRPRLMSIICMVAWCLNWLLESILKPLLRWPLMIRALSDSHCETFSKLLKRTHFPAGVELCQSTHAITAIATAVHFFVFIGFLLVGRREGK